jgi:hypothetical protein
VSVVTATDAPARRDDVFWVEVDGEAVLLHETDHQLHRLNTTASLVWSCLDGVTPLETIARDISDVLGLPFEPVLHDTLTIGEQLLEQQLAHVAS